MENMNIEEQALIVGLRVYNKFQELTALLKNF